MSGVPATPEQIEAARAMWLDSTIARKEIARRLGKSIWWLYSICKRLGWPDRKRKAKGSRKPVRSATSFRTEASLANAVRHESAMRDRTLYGPLVDDVQFLRRRGFGIHRERGGFRVGSRLMDAETVQAVAARERRLAARGARP